MIPENDELLLDFNRLAEDSLDGKVVVLGDVREIVKNELVRVSCCLHDQATGIRNAANAVAARADEI